MFFRKAKRIVELENRVHELEEILCPCKQHDLVQVDKITHYGNDPQSISFTHVMQCKRCKAIVRVHSY